jgi:hypothetical protein
MVTCAGFTPKLTGGATDPSARLKRYAASESQATSPVDNLVNGIITGQSPFLYIENNLGKAAGRALGIELPSAKVLAGLQLEKILAKQHTFTTSILQDIDYLGGRSWLAKEILPIRCQHDELYCSSWLTCDPHPIIACNQEKMQVPAFVSRPGFA